MNDQAKNDQGKSNAGNTSNAGNAGEAEGKITLSAEQYNALLDGLEELETLKKGGKSGKESYENYDDLVRAGKASRAKEEGALNLDNLSNTELAGLIEDQFSKNAITPLAVAIEGLKLDLEFIRTGGKKGFEDIEEIRDDVLKVISENPNMSVEKAYKLVRVDKPKGNKSEGDDDGREPRQIAAKLNLPGRVVGEKPGMSNTGTKKQGPVTIIDAAKEAVAELGIKD